MREKLIELLGADTCKHECCEDCEYCANREACIEYLKTSMADRLIANGVTIQKWIPVTERLPEEDVRVLVWLGTGDITYTQIDTDRLHKKKWRRWTKNVTHWMPLPEPPKEATNEPET